jgi:hypothetical protein
MDFLPLKTYQKNVFNHFALPSSPSQATDVGAYVINTAFHAVSKQVPLHYLSYAPADFLNQHQSKLYIYI